MALAVTLTLAFRPVGRAHLRTARRPLRPPPSAHARSGLLFHRRSPLRLRPQLHHLPHPARPLRHRHGRRMGHRRLARHGKSPRQTSRRPLRSSSRKATPSAICWPPIAYKFVFPHCGWRPLFFIGGLPALLALFVRFAVTESEVWRKTKPIPGTTSSAAFSPTGPSSSTSSPSWP